MNIVFVCTGNTCRSPMAEGFFKQKTKSFNVNVSSCGINALSGDEASINAINVMQQKGIDISFHRSRKINQYIIDDANYIVCLSSSHYDTLFPYAKDKLILLDNDIPDPYMGSEAEYLQCADSIESEIEKLITSDIFFAISEMEKSERYVPLA